MRLTPAQIGVQLFCGRQLPIDAERSLAERLRSGRKLLAQIAGKDFRYDLAAWHAHFKESREGEYTWGRNIVLPRIMKEALASEDWKRTAHELGNET